MQTSRIAKQAKLILLALSAAAIVACGGGGGSTPVPPTAPVANAGVDQTVGIDRPVTLNGTGSSDANGDALTYAWTLTTPAGSASVLSSATAAMPTFTADKAGTYTATLIVKDAALFSTADLATITVTANRAPTANAGAAQTKVAGDVVTLAGTGNDPDVGDSLTFAWTLAKPAGSAAVLANATTVSPTFTADAAGTYTASLIVSDTTHTPILSSAVSTVTITVGANTLPVARLVAPATAIRGFTISLLGTTSSDANNDVLNYSWGITTKPNASNANIVLDQNPAIASFTPDVTGSYTFSLTVTDARGGVSVATAASSATMAVANNTILTPNVFEPACSGANCGAISPTQYSGAGVGTWRYDNTSAAAATVNVDIAGVAAGKKVTLAFTNASDADATSIPALGTDASSSRMAYPRQMPAHALLTPAQTLRAQHLAARQKMLVANKQLARELRTNSKRVSASAYPAVTSPMPSPAVGAAKTWLDTFVTSSPTSYPSTVKAVCPLSTGRNVVFWVSNTAVGVTPSMITSFSDAVCGSAGDKGFAKMAALSGDVWGSHIYSDLITDSSGLQDINVAFVDTALSYGGYFSGRNNISTTITPASNKALVFFVNATNLVQTNSVNYYQSLLIHEAMHMTNFYQNSIKRDKDHDTWLEETSAMMAEDIIAPAVITGGYNAIISSFPNHVASGGNIGLFNWTQLSNEHYDMGGNFGAFINRQYGLNIFKQMTTGCTTPATGNANSIVCLNNLLTVNGAGSLKEVFARFTASTYGRMPATGVPTGYGFPAKTDGGYSFAAIDLSAMTVNAPAALTTYKRLMQTYINDVIAAGKTRYVRNGVSVPAGTSLQVIVQ